jgi:hypothetical protein
LKYVNDHRELEVANKKTLVYLYGISQWASVEKINLLIERDGQSKLRELISKFSKSWRADGLPTTNKLHLFEAHLADFIFKHNGWGCFGEQGLDNF